LPGLFAWAPLFASPLADAPAAAEPSFCSVEDDKPPLADVLPLAAGALELLDFSSWAGVDALPLAAGALALPDALP
jgi:hypothetical protein